MKVIRANAQIPGCRPADHLGALEVPEPEGSAPHNQALHLPLHVGGPHAVLHRGALRREAADKDPRILWVQVEHGAERLALVVEQRQAVGHGVRVDHPVALLPAQGQVDVVALARDRNFVPLVVGDRHAGGELHGSRAQVHGQRDEPALDHLHC